MSKIYCITNNNSLAERVGENEWYINHGAWGFNILTDDTVGIAGLPANDANTIAVSVYVFEADDETIKSFNAFDDVDVFKAKCPQLDWRKLPPYVIIESDNDDWDDIAF